jgi:DNA-binding NtrC family response regulator
LKPELQKQASPFTPQVLLVEDKDTLRNALRLTLENEGYVVSDFADPKSAIAKLSNTPFQIVLTDLRMPGGTGLDVLRAVKAIDRDIPVIVMTAYGSIDEAVQAMKEGAFDFLQKPVDTNHLLLLVERALEQNRLRSENLLLKEEVAKRYGFPRIIGESDAIKSAVSETQKVAATDASVLLLGESGTGKELFALAVHHLSPRRNKPFVAINCAAIPETLIENELFGHEKGSFTGANERKLGKFELAQGGTIFLDEIGELPLAVQGKLLRALEERAIDRIGGRTAVPVDVRVIAATNRDLKAEAESGEFRLDLFFRLAVFPISIPPLRERGQDIVLLAEYFAEKFGREFRGHPATLAEETVAAMLRQQWPGNVRELANVLERACILADSSELTPNDLGFGPDNTADETAENFKDFDYSGSLTDVSDRALRLVEKRKIREVLGECEQNKTRAAEALGVSYKTLLNKIRDHGIE